MTPDLLFLAGLVLKMAMTATIVVAATLVVERSGPFIGALVAALPTSAGAAYIILALEHPPEFISASAVGTVAVNGIGAMFALTFAALSQRHNVAVSVGLALAAWFVGAMLLQTVTWTPLTAVLFSAGVFTFTIVAGTRFRTDDRVRSARATASDIVMRALIVSVFVVVVTAASHRIGSFASGIFALFPVAMASFFIILHARVGGTVAAAVAAHVQAPLIGLGLGFLAVHYLAVPIGVWWSYAAGLAIGIAWNALIWMIRTMGRTTA
jgi:uncharacterized membrane protein (GlpM family)